MKIRSLPAAAAIGPLLLLSGVNAHAEGFAGNPDLYMSIWAKRMEMSKGIMDKDKDGMISKDEFMAYSEMNAGKGFMMTDRDNDGMISEAEWMNRNPNLYGGFGSVYQGFLLARRGRGGHPLPGSSRSVRIAEPPNHGDLKPDTHSLVAERPNRRRTRPC
jgi:hypothetical protein